MLDRYSRLEQIDPGVSPRTARFFVGLGILLIILQRIAIPIDQAQVPANLIVSAIAVIYLTGKRYARIDPTRLLLFLMFLASASATSLVSPADASLVSLLQVIAYWVPFLLTTATGADDHGRSVLFGVLIATCGAATAAVIQFTVSFRGGGFFDPFAVIPEQYLIAGYNTTYGVGAVGGWDKANGVVFLEPSFLSLFSILGIVLVLAKVDRGRMGTMSRIVAGLVLAAGFLVSTALSGLVLIPALVALLVRNARQLLGFVFAATATLIVVAGSPVFQAFTTRLTSSGSNEARLIRPYTELVPLLLSSRFLMGWGPGSADIAASRLTAGAWETEVTAPTLVKLLYEYGLLGFLLLLSLFLLVVRASTLHVGIKIALVIALLIPTNALVNPLLTPVVAFALALSGAKTAEIEPSRRSVPDRSVS